MSHQERINAKFDEDFGARYDYKVRATVPGYDFLHDMAAALIAGHVPEDAHVLVAGPGIGKELVTLGNRFEHWTFTAFDPSPDMLALTRKAVAEAGLQERVRLIQGTVENVSADLRCDAAVSVLVMHFLPDGGPKANFLNGLAARLAPGAPLILADMHGQRGETGVEGLYACWKTYLRQIDYDADTVDKELEMLHFIPETRICELLAGAGFDAIARFYQAFLFGGWFARKPATR